MDVRLNRYQTRRVDTKPPTGININMLKKSVAYVGIEAIEQLVCSEFGIERKSLNITTRQRQTVLPRQVMMYFLSTSNLYTYCFIADAYGRNHSTVLCSKRLIEDLMSVDSKFNDRVANIARNIIYKALT